MKLVMDWLRPPLFILKNKIGGGEKIWHDFQAEVTYYFNVTEIWIGLDLRKFLNISSTNFESWQHRSNRIYHLDT